MRLIFVIATLLCFVNSSAFALVDFKVKKLDMPAVLKAKKISGNQIKGDLIASGNVEISKDFSTIFADEVRYNQNTKTIEGFGNEVIIKNLEVGKVLTPKFNIKDDFSKGDFFDARMYFIDGSYLFANKISRLTDNKTQLHESFFSICPNDDIVKDNKKAGKIFDFAAISSKSLMINRQTQDISGWNATIKIYNLPIIYFPYLRFPLPDQKRKSGILRPSYVRNTNLGLGITVPIYFDLGKNKDLTLTPSYFFGSNQIVLKNEWRHIVKKGQYKFNIELANNKIRNTIDRNVINRTKKATRWSMYGEGDFDFDLNFGVDFKLKNV